jgi:DNA-binding response OmpR family regulator
MRVLIVEDEPYMAEAIRDGLRLEAIAADIAGDGATALELLRFNAYDIAVLDRDIPGPTGDEIAGLRLDPFRREVHRDGRYVALTRKQFAVLEVLVAAEGGVVSAEELLARAWDENADPFTNAVRITVSALRKRLGEPWLIATVPGVGYRIDTQPDTGREGGDRG